MQRFRWFSGAPSELEDGDGAHGCGALRRMVRDLDP